MTCAQLLALFEEHANHFPADTPVCVLQYDERGDERIVPLECLQIILAEDGSVRRFAFTLGD